MTGTLPSRGYPLDASDRASSVARITMPRPEEEPPPPLASLQADEPGAWRRAFGLLWGSVLRAARRHLSDRGEAEDAAAQALHDTRRAAGTARTWEEVGALAVVIARRRAISRSRVLGAGKRQPAALIPLDGSESGDAGEPPQYAALRALDVREILASLPPDHRELLQDYFLEGLTSDEVARKRGVPAATVRSQVMRLLARLRERQRERRNGAAPECDSSPGPIT